MSDAIPPIGDRLTELQDRRVIDIGGRFDSELRRGGSPRIEDRLLEAGPEEREKLLYDLIRYEIEWRLASNRRPDKADYLARFPNDVRAVEAAFAGVAEAPRAKEPPRRPSGRDLLIGLLAVQNGFATMNALIAALRSWKADQRRSFAEILKEGGAVDEARLVLLEALADEHAKQHGGVESSVASIKAAASTRLAAEGYDLEGIEAEFELTTLGSAVASGEATETYPSRNGDGGASGSPRTSEPRYAIIRHHARGNLGVVYLAKDAELGREVALKRIRDDHAEREDSRRRFDLEAEITAGLEHPSIVPVYGRGATPDGRPYYAMRFIRGETLKGAVKRFHRDGGHANALGLRGLLRRFVGVCEAIAYAHSRGVLHRDLKPANVMLGPFGETLLVDFGLAKPLGRHEGENPAAEGTLHPPSASGSGAEMSLKENVKGTPAFMSPEQATPELTDHLTPASDVYALGATLYYILAAKAPFGGRDVNEVIAKVRGGDFTPPRGIDPHVPRPLDAICVKAMSRDPADRHASALDLARDVERWLADEPVTAYRERPLERAARFARRNKPLVAGAAALVLTALAVLMWDDVRVNRAYDLAERQRDRADENFHLSHAAIRDLGSAVARGRVANLNVSPEFREHFADFAAGYLGKLLSRNPDDPEIRFDAAVLYRERANLWRNRRRHDEAVKWYRAAAKLLGDVAARSPDDRRPVPTLVLTMIDEGENERLRGDLKAAEDLFLAAAERASSLVASEPGDYGYQRTLALALLNLSKTRLSTKVPDLGSIEKAVALLRVLNGGLDVDPQDMILQADALRVRAECLVKSGKSAEAERDYRESASASGRFERMVETGRYPQSGTPFELYRIDLNTTGARSELGMARLLAAGPRRDEAISHLDHAVRALAKADANSPRVGVVDDDLADAYLLRAELNAERGRRVEAGADLDVLATMLDRKKNDPAIKPLEERIRTRIEELKGGLSKSSGNGG